MAMGFHSTRLASEDLCAMDVMSMILGRGDNSRLNRSLEKSLGPDYSVSRSDRWRFLAEYTGGSAYAMREIAWDCANVLWLQRILWKLFGR